MKSHKISKMDLRRYSSGPTIGHFPNYPVLNSSVFLPGGSGLCHQSIKCQAGYLNNWRKSPIIRCFRDLVRKNISNILLSINYVLGELASDFGAVLENQLFMEATSEEEYMNDKTLYYRLQILLQHNEYDANASEQADLPNSTPMLASELPHGYYDSGAAETLFNCLSGASGTDSISNNEFTTNNADHLNLIEGSQINSYKQGGGKRANTSNELENFLLSGLRPVGSAIVPLLEDASALFTANSDASHFSVIGEFDNGTFSPQGNLSYSSDISFDYHVQHQHLDHGQMGSSKLKNHLRADQNAQFVVSPSTAGVLPVCSPNLLIPQHIPIEVPKVSSVLPGTFPFREISTLEDIVQSCSQIIKSQHNRNPPLRPALQLHFPPKQANGTQLYASDGTSSGNIEDMPPSSKRLKMDNENENSHLLAPPVVQPCAPEGLSYMQQQSESPVSIISEDIVQSCSQMIKSQHNRKQPLHPSLQPQVPLEQSHGAQQYASHGISSGIVEDMPPSPKRLKMDNGNENSHLVAPSVVKPCAPEGLLYLQHHSESPVSINSEVTHVEMEPITNSINDSMRISDVRKSDSHNICKLNSESLPIPSGGGFVCNQMDQIDCTSSSETTDDLKEVPGEKRSENSHCVTNELSVDFKEGEVRTEFIQTEAKPDSDLKEAINPPNPEAKCVLLTDFFTEEQIKEHLSSLRQSIDQSILVEERENSEKVCQLCSLEKLFFAPDPIYCSYCNARIKRGVNYYCTPDEHGTRYCFCTLCYNNSRGGMITVHGIRISKAPLCKKKNDVETEELWVQCNKCKGWQHQICAIFNGKNALNGKAEYTCLKCLLKETESGKLKNFPKNAVFSAKDLPTTELSDHIEQRLVRRLKCEREDRAKVEGKESSEVPGAEDLVVRVVLSVRKTVKVKQNFLDLFHDENYPAEFPYRSKVILLFQKIAGLDVCLFGMYVQEFGSECSHPNKRCVYISYLDSIKYFRPEMKTVNGEALRTFVYHEILISYLEFCKKRGFVTSYIWACPPLKGEDYILYCHPEVQKTPKSDKLRQWYQSMIKKAFDEKIVVSFTNLYDRFFIPSGECNSKVTAARLPYFDGDYWSGAAEDVIRTMEQERMADSKKKGKKTITKRTLKAMGHTNPSDGSTKDILLMQKLGQTILPIKEDFIIVDMQYVCTHCHEAILSGGRWSCSQCKNFHLCERCHDAEGKIYGKDMHISTNMEQHALSQVMVDDVLSDTKDEDVILNNGLLENRQTFLNLCEKNHYQFDTLRRAKYSSVMILHHLQSASVLNAGSTCSICHKGAVVDQRWACEICPEFGVCATCYQEKGSSCHIHKLTQSSCTVSHRTDRRQAPRDQLQPTLHQKRQMLVVLQHACKCLTAKIQHCPYPFCLTMKKFLCHPRRCPVGHDRGCPMCTKARFILKEHSGICKEPNCVITRCKSTQKSPSCRISQDSELQRFSNS